VNSTTKLGTAILVGCFDVNQEQLQQEEFVVLSASQAADKCQM